MHSSAALRGPRAQERSSPCSEPCFPPVGPRTSSSTPSRARTARRHDSLARTDYKNPTAPTSHPSPYGPNYSPRPPRIKSSPTLGKAHRRRIPSGRTRPSISTRGEPTNFAGPTRARIWRWRTTSPRACRPPGASSCPTRLCWIRALPNLFLTSCERASGCLPRRRWRNRV